MIECVVATGNELGESPLWDEDRQCLYWVDSTGCRIHRFVPKTGVSSSWRTPSPVGSIALDRDGGIVAALQSEILTYSGESALPQTVARIEGQPADHRLNDGRVDAAGRFWVGSMTGPSRQPDGCLFCVDQDFRISRKAGGFTISNTLCWSPDSQTLYHGDSPRRTVWAWDFDAANGEIDNRRIFLGPDSFVGMPDGAVTDAEGFIWIAQITGWLVTRFDPAGRREREYRLPTQNPTCPAFGGPHMQTLYVTTGTVRMTAEQRAEQPLAGGLFAIETGIRGRPEHRFGQGLRS